MPDVLNENWSGEPKEAKISTAFRLTAFTGFIRRFSRHFCVLLTLYVLNIHLPQNEWP